MHFDGYFIQQNFLVKSVTTQYSVHHFCDLTISLKDMSP